MMSWNKNMEGGLFFFAAGYMFRTVFRIRILFLCLFVIVLCVHLHAEEVWYQPYEEGIKDFESGNLAVAEGKFLRAIQLKPDPEKNAKKYGQRFIEYVPQYYLAVIYYRQGKAQLAEQQLAILAGSNVLGKAEIQQRLKKDGVDLSGSREAEVLVARGQEQLNQRRLADAEKTIEELKAKFPKDTNLPKLEAVLFAKKEASALVEQTRQLLQARRLADAEAALKRAKSQDSSHPEISKLLEELAAKQKAEKLIARAEDLRKSGQLDAALESLKLAESKDPENQQINDLRKQILQDQKSYLAQAQKRDSFERLIQQANDAVAANRFDEARSLLNQASSTGVNAQRVGELKRSIDGAESAYYLLEGENALKKLDFIVARQSAQRVQQIGFRTREATNLMQKTDAAEVLKLVQDGEGALRTGNLLKAQDFASRALQINRNHPRANELFKKVRIRQELDSALFAASKKDWKNAQFHALEVKKLDPDNPELAELLTALQKKEAPPPPAPDPLAQERDTALLAYFTGDYEKAAKILTGVNEKVRSSQTLFYLACSNAALGFMQGSDGKELLARATKQFAMVKEMEPDFDVDPSLISPRILRIYRQAN